MFPIVRRESLDISLLIPRNTGLEEFGSLLDRHILGMFLNDFDKVLSPLSRFTSAGFVAVCLQEFRLLGKLSDQGRSF